MYYLISDSLKRASREEIRQPGRQFVAVLTAEEWRQRRDDFDMVIDMDMETPPVLDDVTISQKRCKIRGRRSPSAQENSDLLKKKSFKLELRLKSTL